MRDHSSHREVSRSVATELLLGVTAPIARTETVPVAQAVGRVLAAPVVAQLDMPNCLTCMMDSVAVHWDDFASGMPDTTGWQRGREWEFANTGIGMPEGFDTAIVIEHVTLGRDFETIAFDAAPSKQYAGTRAAGSKMHAGDVLARAGEIVTPLLASHIASGNNAVVTVVARPRVAFIPTGNELVKPGEELARGKNIETNSILAAAKIAAWGGEPVVWDIVPDGPALIKQAVMEAAASCDAVVLNAGSSKGSDDWNIEMLEEAGEVLYHETNHGPGHHSSGAVVDGTPIVGISGPPGGASFTMDFYLYPVVRALQGLDPALPVADVRLKEAFPAKASKPKKTSGDVRPSIVADNHVFYAIKQLYLETAADGTRWAVPASSSHPDPVEASGMDCYYELNSADAPEAGDAIRVILRP